MKYSGVLPTQTVQHDDSLFYWETLYILLIPTKAELVNTLRASESTYRSPAYTTSNERTHKEAVSLKSIMQQQVTTLSARGLATSERRADSEQRAAGWRVTGWAWYYGGDNKLSHGRVSLGESRHRPARHRATSQRAALPQIAITNRSTI